MAVLKVEEMHCNKCVERINSALDTAKISHKVDLANKEVYVDGDNEAVKRAIEELDDLGFEAVEE